MDYYYYFFFLQIAAPITKGLELWDGETRRQREEVRDAEKLILLLKIIYLLDNPTFFATMSV